MEQARNPQGALLNLAAASINYYIEGLPSNEEAVQLEVTDGETYKSRKFAIITQALVSGNTDNDAHINVTHSGATATINYVGMTDQAVTLTLFGVRNK